MEGQIVYQVDDIKSRLEGISERIVGALTERLDAITIALQAKIVGEKLEGNPIKSHTHKLASSVRTVPVEQSGDLLTAGVEAGGGPAFYAKFLEYGTAPHEILPVTKKALAFLVNSKNNYAPWGGIFANDDSLFVITKHVHHPGTQAYRFMAGTLEESKEDIIASLRSAIAEVLG